MNLEKYKWKSRILLVSMPNYRDRIYLEAKKIYQDKIKNHCLLNTLQLIILHELSKTS